ncbi:squalene synthase [Plectosphaerella cucumerina]|uniref:Squalene synthase n=1 Tax=Plectosphaerella cucumerina TaxID=40658 RepID=A0A8K0TPQ9_9PEZI|nr:squalene synthase [Plectosphaerella cucumerina]
MGVIFYIFHPQQLRSIIQWKLWHDPVHSRNPEKESDTMKACYEHLNKTSRSFSAVIQELNPEMVGPICLFYLVLRGLDTIEDDLTIPLAKKDPLLREFHTNMEIDGWTFTENGPNEKDRNLLVHFDDVVTELKLIQPKYYEIIKDITIKMGNGMADYANNAEFNANGVESIKDYELYCHYVAGLVGEGLTRLFVEGELANPRLKDRPELTESMGQFLQKTNIIRDIEEDFVDGRRWWPKEIWSKHVDNFEDLFKPEHKEKALNCSSEMVLNALKHAEDCLFYMAGMRDQSVFNFVAIPQSMAIATLELVFRNYDIFHKHIKITKGDACQLMLDSTQNLFVVCDVFKKYVRKIHKKNDPRDPNFVQISAQCAKIEQFIDTLYPRQDPKKLSIEAKKKENSEPTMDPGEAAVLLGITIVTLLCISGIMIGVAWFFGARFDSLWKSDEGFSWPVGESASAVPSIEHPEL